MESKRNWGEKALLERISFFSPLVIACDTNPSHKLGQELKRAFGAKLFFPRKSLREWYKQKITVERGCKNKHERDALAAALKAYHHFENKLRQTSKKAGKHARAAQKMVLSGEKMVHAVRRLQENGF